MPCRRRWIYLLGEGGVIYSESQNRFADLDAAGIAAYMAFDADAQAENLRIANTDSLPAGAINSSLQHNCALSQGVLLDTDAASFWPA